MLLRVLFLAKYHQISTIFVDMGLSGSKPVGRKCNHLATFQEKKMFKHKLLAIICMGATKPRENYAKVARTTVGACTKFLEPPPAKYQCFRTPSICTCHFAVPFAAGVSVNRVTVRSMDSGNEAKLVTKPSIQTDHLSLRRSHLASCGSLHLAFHRLGSKKTNQLQHPSSLL